MRILICLMLVSAAIFFIEKIGSADRLYKWVDSEGVIHLSKQPPPEGGESVKIMEYSGQVDQPEGKTQKPSSAAVQKQRERTADDRLHETSMQPKPKKNLSTSCYLQAGKHAVYFYVTEDLRPGGSSYQKVLFKGDIDRGQRMLIKSLRGKIQYSYQRSSDDRAYGRNSAECKNGNVIKIE